MYAGGDPRTALRKLLVSDAAADLLVVPRDCYDGICEVLEATIAHKRSLLSRIQQGQVDRQMGMQHIQKQLQKLGLQLHPETLEATFAGQKLGTITSAGFMGQFRNRIKRDKLTSQEILERQLASQVAVAPEFARFQAAFSGHHSTTADLIKTYQRTSQQLLETGLKPAQANRLAAQQMHQQFGPQAIAQVEQSRRAALWQGASESDVLQTPLEGDLAHYDSEMKRLGQNAHRAKQRTRQALVLTLAAFETSVDLVTALNHKESFADWLKQRGLNWGTRRVVNVTTEKAIQIVEHHLIPPRGGPTLPPSPKLKMLRVGAATALFVVGESLVAVVLHNASWAEVRDIAAETTFVILATESAVLGSSWLMVSAGYGSLAGPVGFGVALGTGLLYSGTRYFYDRSLEIEEQQLVIGARCDAARTIVNRWSEAMLKRSVGQ